MRLKEERQRRRWSQTRLGMAAGGIAQGDISAIENCRRVPGAGWRRRLAAALGVPEAKLFPERRRAERLVAERETTAA